MPRKKKEPVVNPPTPIHWKYKYMVGYFGQDHKRTWHGRKIIITDQLLNSEESLLQVDQYLSKLMKGDTILLSFQLVEEMTSSLDTSPPESDQIPVATIQDSREVELSKEGG